MRQVDGSPGRIGSRKRRHLHPPTSRRADRSTPLCRLTPAASNRRWALVDVASEVAANASSMAREVRPGPPGTGQIRGQMEGQVDTTDGDSNGSREPETTPDQADFAGFVGPAAGPSIPSREWCQCNPLQTVEGQFRTSVIG